MTIRPIADPVKGEHLLDVQPTLSPTVRNYWPRRLNLFNGRSLSDIALRTLQTERSGRIVTLAQTLSPGVVTGLEVSLEPPADAVVMLHIAAGAGLAASGEDVRLPAGLRVDVDELPIHNLDQVVSDLTPASPLPRAMILVLQPIQFEVIGELDPDDPCPLDSCGGFPSTGAFDDWLISEGCRPVLVPWPDLPSLPLPAFDADIWRNRLAWAIFNAEAALDEGQVLPWEDAGLPIALVGFDNDWAPLFADRDAVARAGGRAKRRRQLVSNSGNEFLWRARIEQFNVQVAGTASESASSDLLARQFRFLPPVGILPPDVIDAREGRNRFFPSSFAVEALPAPLEQLDVAVNESASLAAYDTASLTPETVRVLVPVPQTVYEPRLLVREEVDPVFQETIDRFVVERGRWLRGRLDARAAAGTAIRSRTGRNPFDPVPPDPDQLETDEAVADNLTAEQAETYGFPAALSQRFREIFAENGSLIEFPNLASAAPLTQAEFDQLAARGVEGFITFIDGKIRNADDKIDFGFLRAQADIYRVRQLILGTTTASRLATSPALAEIVKGFSALATKEDLDKFIGAVRQRPSGGIDAGPGPVDGPVGGGTGPGRGPVTGPIGGGVIGRASISNAALNVSRDQPFRAALSGAGRLAGPILAGPGTDLFLNQPNIPGRVAIDTGTVPFAIGGQFAEVAIAGATRDDVILQNPIIGEAYDFRTVAIAERLENPPANEAKSFTVSSKHGVVSAMLDTDLNVADLEIPGFQTVGGTPDQPVITETRRRFGEINANVLGEILGGNHDRVPANADEAAFFSAGVRALDNAVATLRIVEGRIQSYRNVLQRARRVLDSLKSLETALNQRLTVIAGGLAEARSDVATARALLADEETRVEDINDRRDRVIADHVSFVLFHRPRVVDAILTPPARPVNPAAGEDAVPLCLRQHEAQPPELTRMIALLREAPVKWFPRIQALLNRLDRLDTLQGAVLTSRLRAAASLTLATPVVSTSTAVNRVLVRQQQIVGQYRSAAAGLNIAVLAGQSWTQSRDQAKEVLSIGDLIDSSQTRANVAREAAVELDRIAGVAACLHARFSDVLPRIRLDWAERLSQFDAEVNLRNLASLPRFNEIEFLDRVELQQLVDFLHSRIDGSQSDAFSAINDLVHLCLLLASHSPVNQIIAGLVTKPVVAVPGGRIEVTVDLSKIRLGMNVLVYTGPNVVARAVVDDIAPERVSARVTQTAGAGAGVTVNANARVQFVES